MILKDGDHAMKASIRLRMFQKDTGSSRMAAAGLWLAGAFWLTLLAIGMPTGLGTGLDIAAILILHTLAYLMISVMIAWFLTMVRLPLPRFYIGCLLYSAAVLYMIMRHSVGYDLIASVVLTAAIIVSFSALGVAIKLLADRLTKLSIRVVSGMLTICLITGILAWPLLHLLPQSSSQPPEAGSTMLSMQELAPDNPAHLGTYRYETFTYSNGTDKHRPEFGEQTTLKSGSVDASLYIHNWNSWREIFWGFDERQLPLNGRVWMPQGEGPFPLVLIVHGNHTMEKFSDDGYAYLGELLASRGMIAVSVDQNFLNFSHWSGIPNDNYLLRAWMLLQHIKQIAEFRDEPGTPFFGKTDLHQIAIIGHSRGGQAAAMAADAGQWFADDASLLDPASYTIQAIVALAPTDVNVDKKAPILNNIHYLMLHGGRDADVNTLTGDEQYARVHLSDPERFKAAVFIEDANHSFFNASWGPHDQAMPKGIFLNQRETMTREEQELVTKVYVSAFLEIVFHGEREYEKVFRDDEYVSKWLPDRRYFTRFQSGAVKLLTDFDQPNAASTARYGSRIVAEGFTEWKVSDITNQDGRSKGTKGAILEFRDEAQFTVELSEQFRNEVLDDEDCMLTFSIMNAEHELELHEDEVPSEELEIHIELETEDGDTFSVPLSDYAEIVPVPETTYTTLPILEDRLKDGKYENNVIPVLQTVEIPLDEFPEMEDELLPDELERIMFQFEDGPARIVLDDIGFVAEPYL